MSAQLVTLLALVGAALAAVAIFAPHRLPPPSPAVSALLVPIEREAMWTQCIDPGFASCDALARIELVDALAALGTPWAHAALRTALADDADARVRAAAARVLARGKPPAGSHM
jgi:HEAT repeat protein